VITMLMSVVCHTLSSRNWQKVLLILIIVTSVIYGDSSPPTLFRTKRREGKEMNENIQKIVGWRKGQQRNDDLRLQDFSSVPKRDDLDGTVSARGLNGGLLTGGTIEDVGGGSTESAGPGTNSAGQKDISKGNSVNEDVDFPPSIVSRG